MTKKRQQQRVTQQPRPPAELLRLREQVEAQRLSLESSRLKKQLALAESVTDSIFGTPIPFEQIYSYQGRALMPLFARDYYQAKPTTLRTMIDIDRQRQLARYAYETNENAKAGINGLCSYVVGNGFDAMVAPKEETKETQSSEPLAEVVKAQAIVDEFVEINELKEAADGCPLYDEAFVRYHVEGESILRLFIDEIEPTHCRFVEPDNLRPPMNQNWEGPWSFGILTAGRTSNGGYGDNLAWDTQTPRGYNINYPLIDQDEQVAAHEIFHLKANVKKNQKRGISSLYACDETLRGTQKLRYAAREGAKIRASIPYIRQHAQADMAAIGNMLQQGIPPVPTQEAPRVDQWGGQYNVDVQQVEPGSVADISAGMEVKETPADPNADGVESNLRHGIETIAACLRCPPWLVGGSSGDASYADGLVKESPFYKMLVKQQAIHTGFWKRVFVRVLEIAEEQGRLPLGATQRLKVTVTAEDPKVRNESERLEGNIKLRGQGGLSLRTLITESGHDPDDELAQIEQEEQEGIPKPGQPGSEEDLDEEGNPRKSPQTVGGQRQRDQGGMAEQFQEQLAEVAVATAVNTAVALQEAWDETKHPRGQPENAGEFASSAGSAVATQKRAASRQGEVVSAKKVGKGRDAKIILANGEEAPAHIKPGMIPPAWRDVMIHTDPDSEVLVEARDEKGRKKIVYSDSYANDMAEAKFYRVRELLRESVELHDQNQANRKNAETREEADCLWLIEQQATRPGSDKDTGGKVKAYGATTLLAEHVEQRDGEVWLHFIGKEGIEHNHRINDKQLGKMLIARKEAAGEGGRLFSTNSNKLLQYTRSLDHGRFTPKDFRTKRANELAAEAIRKRGDAQPKSKKERMAWIKEVATHASSVLGNKPSQCVESYIDPSVWSVWGVANA